MDETQHQTPREKWDRDDNSAGHHFKEEPRYDVGQDLHQSGEETVKVGVSIHVRGTQGQAKIADCDGEPECKWRKKR